MDNKCTFWIDIAGTWGKNHELHKHLKFFGTEAVDVLPLFSYNGIGPGNLAETTDWEVGPCTTSSLGPPHCGGCGGSYVGAQRLHARKSMCARVK